MPDKKKLIYLASPYSHPSKAMMEARFKAVCMAAGRLMLERADASVFSPIAHSHPIHLANPDNLPNTYEFWVEGQDLFFFERCDELWIYTISGWRKSTGVMGELYHWRDLPKTLMKDERAASLLDPTPEELAVLDSALYIGIGPKLKQARIDKLLTLREAALAIEGASIASVNNIEKGWTTPTRSEVEAMANLYGVTEADLLEDAA